MANSTDKMDKTIWIIFGSLLLDLLAFTMILPLLPALLDHYRLHDGENGYYKWLESSITYFQKLLGTPPQFNSVLFGGFLGSLYSFLQFLASPVVGGLSDVYGRKPVLLLCLVSKKKFFWHAKQINSLFLVIAGNMFLIYFMGPIKKFCNIRFGENRRWYKQGKRQFINGSYHRCFVNCIKRERNGKKSAKLIVFFL